MTFPTNHGIYIELDNGATLQIVQTGEKFQLLEVFDCHISAKQKVRTIGSPHTTLWGAVEEIRRFDLAQYEKLTLNEMLTAVQSTNAKLREWFELHNDYLATL